MKTVDIINKQKMLPKERKMKYLLIQLVTLFILAFLILLIVLLVFTI